MKVTVVATVLNNEGTVGELVDSIYDQSRKPDEVIVVDGGSHDGTVEVLKQYEKKHKNFRFFSHKLNKAKSRNFGINEANHALIAQIDGSCVAERDWLKNLLRPMKDRQVGVSAGFYKIMNESDIAMAASPFIGVSKKILDPRAYMPTGRSMAVRKSVWKSLHGYSEDLQWSGEDNLFNYKLLKKGVVIARAPDAVVRWYAPKTFTDVSRKVFAYTAGIAQTGTWMHPCESLATVNTNILWVYLRWALGLLFLGLSLYHPIFLYISTLGVSFYLFSSIYRRRELVERQRALMLVPLVQIIVDLSVIAGFASGFVMPAHRHKKLQVPTS